MKNNRLVLSFLFSLLAVNLPAQSLEKGVSKELAEQRKASISNVAYDLTFNIPASKKDKVTGKAVISFNLKNKEDVVLDFQGKLQGDVLVGKKKRKVSTQNEHIIVPMKFLKPGPVTLTLEFTALDDALNRNEDYMYSLFVPDHARSAFPCFDQPDLRARFTTTLNVPQGWKTICSDGSNPIPTYLYSFVAGNYQEKSATIDGRTMRALYRETDPDKVQQLDKVFEEASQSLKWMESYTGIQCPFKEYGLVILPGYQFGGMEHPGAIQLSDRRVFLGKNPTKEEELSRMELIAHETAHLWFGDMVSLKWFADVWAKEVYANFMASKITRRHFSKIDHDLNFIKTYQARAIAIDRTEGTHPIAMPLDNLNCASLLYDNIIYDKAPVMMRMLEQTMGATDMQNGLRRYLSDHYFQNASWDELITTLDKESPTVGVQQFSEVWVKQKGMPVIHTSYKDGQIIISQTDPYGRGLCWRQKFQVFVIYDLGSSRTLTVDMQQPIMTFKVKGKPSFIIPNYDGQGYGRFTLDDEFTNLLPLRLITTRNDLNRYALLLTIHDNYLMGKVNPAYFGELYRLMMKEKNPLIMSTAIDHMFKIATDMAPDQRKTLELCMMDLLGENKNKECRQLIIRKLAANMTSPDVMRQINAIWEAHNETIFDEHDYMDMAYRLAMLQPNYWQEILGIQRARLQTDDLKKEFDYVSRACNPDASKRDELFRSLLKPQNRQQEPWALHLLNLLSCDLYQPENIDYITTSLKSLEDIQKTSDIFFPGNWMSNLLARHQSVPAKQAIEKFLETDKSMPDNLKNKVLEAAWTLRNQQAYVEKAKPVVVNNPKTTKAKTTTKTKTTTKKRGRTQ
jgi:aminopeptidase N